MKCGPTSAARPMSSSSGGLKDCVKQIVGAQRWCGRCRWMHGQIVSYLRTCLDQDSRKDCSLLIK